MKTWLKRKFVWYQKLFLEIFYIVKYIVIFPSFSYGDLFRFKICLLCFSETNSCNKKGLILLIICIENISGKGSIDHRWQHIDLSCSDLIVCIANKCPSNCDFFFFSDVTFAQIHSVFTWYMILFLPYASVLRQIEGNINFRDLHLVFTFFDWSINFWQLNDFVLFGLWIDQLRASCHMFFAVQHCQPISLYDL